MDIEVRVTMDQWEEIAILTEEYENAFWTEEEFGEKLHEILGSALRTVPGDADTLHLVLEPKTQILVH